MRLGSAKAAASELGVSKAAVSAHTAALRRELDDPLYHRSANGLSFTPGGLRLATRAAELLGLQDLTRLEVQAAGRGQRLLRVAATALFAEYAAPGLFELFKTRAKDLGVEMSVQPSGRFRDLLDSRQADITIGPSVQTGNGRAGIGTGGTSVQRQFLRYQLIPVVSPRHPLATRRATAAELRSVPWLLGPSVVETTGATAELLRRFDVPEDQQRIFQSHAAAVAEASDGSGVGLVPEFRVREAVTEGRLARVSAPGAAAQSTWVATTLPGGQAMPVATELARFVSTPRAIQAMLSGTGANVGRFRPRVHVTLWS